MQCRPYRNIGTDDRCRYPPLKRDPSFLHLTLREVAYPSMRGCIAPVTSASKFGLVMDAQGTHDYRFYVVGGNIAR